jgi:hypothetical protein
MVSWPIAARLNAIAGQIGDVERHEIPEPLIQPLIEIGLRRPDHQADGGIQ